MGQCRKAGIIFLGDFWHSRGALPVELLNMAILQLQTWKCPAIFIPGNHDQVGRYVPSLSEFSTSVFLIFKKKNSDGKLLSLSSSPFFSLQGLGFRWQFFFSLSTWKTSLN
jgi:calcineurin-like phosphoesterase family protein